MLLPRNVVTLENHFVIKRTNAGILNPPPKIQERQISSSCNLSDLAGLSDRGIRLLDPEVSLVGRVLTVTCIVVLFLEEIFQLL